MQNTDDPVLDRIRKKADQTRRGVRSRGIAKLLAVVFITAWGSWLCGQVGRLDAEGAGLLARQRFEDSLPGAHASIKARLEQKAPELAAQIVERTLAVPATVRERAEESILASVDEWARLMEEGMRSQLVLDVAALRREIDARHPQLDDEEKVRRLAKEAVAELRGELQAALTSSMEPFTRCLESTRVELEQFSDPTTLSERERVQREILITTRELLARMQERGETAIPDEVRNATFANPLANIR